MLNQNPAATQTVITVGIATRGRPATLAQTIARLKAQLRTPDAILVAYPAPADVADLATLFPDVQLLLSEPGLTRQRNRILNNLPPTDILVFLDDDFFLHPNYLAVLEDVFLRNPHVAAATGTLLADGIHTGGLDPVAADRLIAAHQPTAGPPALAPIFNAYGCNMAFRMSIVNAHQLRFDEDLPLYGWYEDVDFSRRVSRHGASVKIDQAIGVHLGVSSGRHSQVRLGYSQIANPAYLAQKRSVPWTFALASILSRTLKNLVFSLRPESHIDRRGRLRGNLLAFRDALRHTLHPTRVNHM